MASNMIRGNYEDIISSAENIRNDAKNLNLEFTNSFKNIADMHNNWHGEFYKKIATKFADIVQPINTILDVVVEKMPYNIEAAGKNYKGADTGDSSSIKEETAEHVGLEIPTDKPGDFYIDFSAVDAIRKKVIESLGNAKNNISNINNTVAGLDWEGDAAEKNKSDFSTSKDKITTSIEDINSTFESIVLEGVKRFEEAESSNKAKM
ncbi:MAG: hypothetical protein IKF36_04475 [Bacilli bacterium]|nr:hypothetical protein [Bacilli bacterium]